MLSPRRQKSAFASGASLLEVLIVVAIMAALASILVPLIRHFQRKGQDAACMGNLRTLHTSFSGYLLDHGMVWPQVPEGMDDSADDENDALAEFWFKTMEPYGSHRETWLCPSERTTFAQDTDSKIFDASYSPTQFDETPNVAYQWVRQPWVIERGGFHGGEANMVMPDGAIRKEHTPMMVP